MNEHEKIKEQHKLTQLTVAHRKVSKTSRLTKWNFFLKKAQAEAKKEESLSIN